MSFHTGQFQFQGKRIEPFDKLGETFNELQQLAAKFEKWKQRVLNPDVFSHRNGHGDLVFAPASMVLLREASLCESAIASVSDRLSALIESVGC